MCIFLRQINNNRHTCLPFNKNISGDKIILSCSLKFSKKISPPLPDSLLPLEDSRWWSAFEIHLIMTYLFFLCTDLFPIDITEKLATLLEALNKSKKSYLHQLSAQICITTNWHQAKITSNTWMKQAVNHKSMLGLNGWVRVLRSFNYFSHFKTMEGWTWKALCNEVPFRFGKNLVSSGIRTRDPVIRSRSANRSATRTLLC